MFGKNESLSKQCVAPFTYVNTQLARPGNNHRRIIARNDGINTKNQSSHDNLLKKIKILSFIKKVLEWKVV